MNYKYKSIPISDEEIKNMCEGLMEKLNALGRNGWELVTILSRQGFGNSSHNLFGITNTQVLLLKKQIA